MKENGVSSYLGKGLIRLVSSVLKESAADAVERRFLLREIRVQKHRMRVRERQEKAGLHIPAFLIASITEQCNLHCRGCYARGCGFCTDSPKKQTLSADDWMRIFVEADKLGISAILLAGGEPLVNRAVLLRVAEMKNLIFPVFTNGTLFDEEMLTVFSKSRNLFPVFSIEGGKENTDARRGTGVFDKAVAAADALRKSGALFGVSVTVSAENISEVTSDAFFERLTEMGAAVLFLVEYAASAEADRVHELSTTDRRYVADRLESARKRFSSLWFLSFPGDEVFMGGCLAAGRGFFHINPSGGAEPCPFSPFSDRNLKNCTLKEAISSPLFKKLTAAELTRIPHDGGCALAGKADEVAVLLSNEERMQ